MQFTPKTNEQLDMIGLLEEGIYQFTVLASEDAISKSGNEMIKMQLKVWDKSGGEHIIYDYLLEAFIKKLSHFAKATGLEDKYNLGTINAEDCKHKSGYLELIVQHDKTGQYGPRNSVKDYVLKPKKDANDGMIKERELFDDAIPF